MRNITVIIHTFLSIQSCKENVFLLYEKAFECEKCQASELAFFRLLRSLQSGKVANS